MSGVLLGATFSQGCRKAVDLGINDMLKEFVSSKGEGFSEEEIREALQKLASYLFYRVIALSNKINDPFEEKVVRAHWIGNEFLDKVKPRHAAEIIRAEAKEKDFFPLAFVLKPVLRGEGAHHNAYVRWVSLDRNCRVILEDGYFSHLGLKRQLAKPEDIKAFKKYGRV